MSELRRLGVGGEAEVFEFGEGRVLRLAHDPAHAPFVEREALALAAAKQAGAPVPAVYERLTVEGRPGVLMDRLYGEDLLTRLDRRPLSVFSLARTLGRLHAELHKLTAPGELPSLREDLQQRLASELVPYEVREPALARLAELPDGNRLCHGDFHPGNLLQDPDSCAVIDWTSSARGHPSADVARTRLLLAGGVPPEASLVTRALEPLGRKVLLRGYLRAYRSESELDLGLVEHWVPVCAAGRLAEDIDEAERAGLLAIARTVN